MGLFNDDNEDRRDEVVIDVPEEESGSSNRGTDTRLGKEVGSKLSKSSGNSSDVTVEDVHEQNKRIIQLLEQIKDTGTDNVEKENGSRGREDNGIRGGMDELL